MDEDTWEQAVVGGTFWGHFITQIWWPQHLLALEQRAKSLDDTVIHWVASNQDSWHLTLSGSLAKRVKCERDVSDTPQIVVHYYYYFFFLAVWLYKCTSWPLVWFYVLFIFFFLGWYHFAPMLHSQSAVMSLHSKWLIYKAILRDLMISESSESWWIVMHFTQLPVIASEVTGAWVSARF